MLEFIIIGKILLKFFFALRISNKNYKSNFRIQLICK